MFTWYKDIKWGKVLLCGIIYTFIASLIHQIEAILTMKYYMMPQYFGVWSKLMMPANGPPPPDFFIASAVFTFCSGISLCMVYYYIRYTLPKEYKKRIIFFAELLIATSFIFFTLPSYLLFNLPLGLLISWFISSFVILLSASTVLVKILK